MKTLYCWRCRADIPMLDEHEWALVAPLLSRSLADTKADRESSGLPLSTDLLAHRFTPALEAYERLTGFHETNGEALWHHRLSLYGPPRDVSTTLRQRRVEFTEQWVPSLRARSSGG